MAFAPTRLICRLKASLALMQEQHSGPPQIRRL